MVEYWRKLNHLIPEPQCKTRNGVITEWTDVRIQPTEAEIEAVTMQQVNTSELNNEADKAMQSDKMKKLIFHLNFDQEKRLRILEGKPTISKSAYRTAVKNIYKSL